MAVAAVQQHVEQEILPRVLEMGAGQYSGSYIAIRASTGQVVVVGTETVTFWKEVYEQYGEQWDEHVFVTYVSPVVIA